MTTIRHLLILFLLFLCVSESLATHIVGGGITYECLGKSDKGKRYRFTMKVYRDCLNGQSDFDQLANIAVYRGSYQNNNLFESFQVELGTQRMIGINEPGCISDLPSLCLEEAIYVWERELPETVSSYFIEYQRCCRTTAITNILNPGQTGATYYTEITARAQQLCNNSPVFNNFPPVVICNNYPLEVDYSATDADGDQLVYSFCAPYAGGGPNNTNTCSGPAPQPPCAPPFNELNFATPTYTALQPMAGNPAISIDPQTGIISGTPNKNGQFVVGVCVEEYRNGTLLSITRREFQFNVAPCSPQVTARVEYDSILGPQQYVIKSCSDSTTIHIINKSAVKANIKQFLWTFDLKNGNFFKDSTHFDATVNFPGYGSYTGTLVLNGGLECRNTAYIRVDVLPVSNLDIGPDLQKCADQPIQLEVNSTEFNQIKWNIGTTVPTLKTIANGTYWVTARNRCGALDVDSVTVSLQPNCPCPQNTYYKKFGESDHPERGNTLCAAKDGGLYMAGSSNDQPFLAKFNASGELLWSKKISQTLVVAELIEDSDGMLVGLGTFGQTKSNITGTVFRYNPIAHQFFWIKVLQGLDPKAASIIESAPGGNYIISINPEKSGNPISEVHEINRATGNLLAAKSRAFSYKSGMYVSTMIQHKGVYYLYGWAHGQDEDIAPFLPNSRTMLMQINGTNLLPDWGYLGPDNVAAPEGSYQGMDLVVDHDSLVSVFVGTSDPQIFPVAVYLQKTTLTGEVVWIKKYQAPGTFVEELVAVSDGYLILTHNSSDTRYLLKTDKNGNLLFTKQLKASLTAANLTLSNVGSNQNQLLPVGNQVYLLSFEEKGDASGILMKMNENGFIADFCGFGNPLNILSEKIFDPVITSIALDTRPSQTIAIALAASVSTFDLPMEEACACSQSTICNVTLDLGPDIVSCKDSAVVLSAGAGFLSFQWQDGSTAPTFNAVSTGRYSVAATDSCGNIFRDTIQVTILPTPMRTRVIQFYPNQPVTLGGQVYSQPDTIVLNVASTTGGCDSVNTYILELLPTAVGIECPTSLTVTLPLSTKTIAVTYSDPTFTNNCPGPQASIKRLQGQPSGGTFTAGIHQVCYEAQNDCGNRDTCCFNLTVLEPANPCDDKVAGCMRFDLLSIRLDSINQRRYRIQATNSCTSELAYLAIQLPNGVVAVKPANGTTYSAPGTGHLYTVRNPNASPFYSIRYQSAATGIHNSEADIFEYTLPQQSQPVYIQIGGRLKNGELYTTYLNTFNCPVLTENGKPGRTESVDLDIERAPAAFAIPNTILRPNPTDGLLQVNMSPWKNEQVHIQVLNAQGQLVLSRRYDIENEWLELELNADLKNGLYYLMVQPVDGEQVAMRFILQR